MGRPILRGAVCCAGWAAMICAPGLAIAATSAGGGLPWETPLATIKDSITGPVAYVISVLGVVVTGATLIFGGEINEFVRRIVLLVMVISLIVAATNILSTLFNTAAVVS
jgi:type IV secretion system protein TrbC